jgi:hypothetical protein
MKNFQEELQMLELDQFQIVELTPISQPNQQKLETPRWGIRCINRCGGFPQERPQPIEPTRPEKNE